MTERNCGWNIVRLMHRCSRVLRPRAAFGGEVVLLRGNHEQMLIERQYKYMQLTDARGFIAASGQTIPEDHFREAADKWYEKGCLKSDHDSPQYLFEALQVVFLKSGVIGKLLRSMPVFRVIKDLKEPIVFVHGGITYRHLENLIDYQSKTDSSFDLKSNPEGNAGLLEEYFQTQKLNDVASSPLWDRSVAAAAKDMPEETCIKINRTLTALAVTRMVVGHTIQSPHKAADNFGCRCKCTVILTDRAMSRSLAEADCLKDTYNKNAKYKPVSALYWSTDGELFTLIEKTSESEEHATSGQSGDTGLDEFFTKLDITRYIQSVTEAKS
eukprot:TRINITY_DN8020_c0_g1_i2.p1 TRINITY_DN8020_c0_g1~~TRINITY_DN8020_c0_g1_i2.p1  ORF type:complete len:327 (+),score=26.81 TRINITY_DN8020_c0_g1_i2:175-1155(+)